jgi:acyl-CoA dehydrogenase
MCIRDRTQDVDFLLALGEIFTLVVYGQLVLEAAGLYGVNDDLIDQIFDVMVRDVSKYALQLYSKPSSSELQMEHCLKMLRKPTVDEGRTQRVWQEVHALKDAYEMNP